MMLNISSRKLVIGFQACVVIIAALLLIYMTKANHIAKLDVKVLSMNSNKCCCIYDTLTIEVNYWGSKPIKPGFIVVTGEEGVNKMWNIVEGPSILKPGSSARYVVEAPSCSCAVRPNKHYRIIVVDMVNGIILGTSRLYYAPNPRC